jgi:hypothetical protein
MRRDCRKPLARNGETAWRVRSENAIVESRGLCHCAWPRHAFLSRPSRAGECRRHRAGPLRRVAQHDEERADFGRYISAIYADRFDSYAGEKLQVTGEEPAFGGVKVRSQIIKASGEPVNIDYLMRRSGDAWLISDIYLDGAISEVATRRSEFAAILRSQGIDGLIAALNRKADILTGTTARSF